MTVRSATSGALLFAGILTCATFASGEAPVSPQPTILEPQQASELVTVEDVTFDHGRVSGVIVNRESHPVRNVRLVIGNIYRWPSEYRPGDQSPNNGETYVVKDEIPAGGRVPFSTTLGRATPATSGGTFVTKAYVVGFTEIIPPQLPAVASPPQKR